MTAAENPVPRIADHIVRTRLSDLPAATVGRIKTFLLDTLGVGIAGTSGAGVGPLIELARTWGETPQATVWLTGERIPAQSAAIVNAYQIHCLEYDCVHEGAVLHPMATILSAVLAWAERESTAGRPLRGADLIPALAVGVDVSTMLGIVTAAPIRFFRPATAGGFGAVAAIARLSGFDRRQTMDALGAQYAQCSGTLQPHVEGSPMLGLQVGFNAAAAIRSADLARAGFRGPHDILTGPYGYFRLYEGDDQDIAAFLPSLGRDWQIDAMSHKPWPSGRLTHGVIDGLGQLMARHGFGATDIARIEARVPPLNFRLVGRPDIPAPEPNYAKLCLRFVAGRFLAAGQLDVPDFRGAALTDPETHRLAGLVDVVEDTANPDQNALDPQRVTVWLTSGAVHAIDLPHVFGHPAVPLGRPERGEVPPLRHLWPCRHGRPRRADRRRGPDRGPVRPGDPAAPDPDEDRMTGPIARPRRSLLFAPANRPALVPKALAAGADIVCLDLEDAVPPQDKDSARAAALPFLAAPGVPGPHPERALRINSPRTRDGLADLLALIAARPAAGTLFLPKVAHAFEVRLVDELLSEAGLPLSIAVLIESAEGLEHANAILGASPRVAWAMFGAVDFAAEYGIAVAPGPLLFARQRLVHAAVLTGVDLLDVPCLAFRDAAAVAAEATAARALGFGGKAALHPDNVAAVNAAFTPAPEEIARAERIVAAYRASPNGLAVLDGKLIEKPVVRAMTRILAVRDAIPS